MKQYRSVTIKGVTFPFLLSTRTFAYYMRKKSVGALDVGADRKLPTALDHFNVWEIAEIFLVGMYMAFKDHERPAILKTEVEDGEKVIKSVLVPTSLDSPTFGIPITVTLDDVLYAMENDSSIMGQFIDAKDPGITPTDEGSEEVADGEKK